MRTHGTLTKWNDDRGFGFLSPAQGTDEIFVHISAFPRDGQRPRIGELLSFETAAGPEGKLKAVRVMRPGQRAASRRPRATDRSDRETGLVGTVFALLAMAAIGVYAYSEFAPSTTETSAVSAAVTTPAATASAPSTPGFTCDGRTMCSQMRSCAEAVYFIKHCPNTKMDGNNDGEPCESQWCN